MTAPFRLDTTRLVLDQPAERDVDDIADYCTDPVFERFLLTPWPYERRHAEFFVDAFVPAGWADDREWTWAIRRRGSHALAGVVSVEIDTAMVGYWLGAPFRGDGIMPEAVGAVAQAAFARTALPELRWECVVGNTASRRVAEKAGFQLTGTGRLSVPHRDGTSGEAWTGRLVRPEPPTDRPVAS